MPNGGVVTDDEAEYMGMQPLIEAKGESKEEMPTSEEIKCPVTCKALVARVKDEDDAQWANLFYTRYHIKNKVLIIDGGSYANVASLLMVEKLALKTVNHPKCTIFNGWMRLVM